MGRSELEVVVVVCLEVDLQLRSWHSALAFPAPAFEPSILRLAPLPEATDSLANQLGGFCGATGCGQLSGFICLLATPWH